MSDVKISILVDNQSCEGWLNEHGLALLIETMDERILFDTGAGGALIPNLKTGKIEPAGITKLILSHGHYDHTGGLSEVLPLLPDCEVFYGHGIAKKRFSRHPGLPVKENAMPRGCAEALAKHLLKREVAGFSAIAPQVSLTGAIPRLSGEDCGGPFYLDPDGKSPDDISDEQALLLDCGILIQGCGHAGIINTVECCGKYRPDVKIHTIIGGLHLLQASLERLKMTADYLNTLALKRLILLHCTGESAGKYLQEHVACETVIGKAGEVYHG